MGTNPNLDKRMKLKRQMIKRRLKNEKITAGHILGLFGSLAAIFTILLGMLALAKSSYFGELIELSEIMTSADTVRTAISCTLISLLFALILSVKIIPPSKPILTNNHKKILIFLIILLGVYLIIDYKLDVLVLASNVINMAVLLIISIILVDAYKHRLTFASSVTLLFFVTVLVSITVNNSYLLAQKRNIQFNFDTDKIVTHVINYGEKYVVRYEDGDWEVINANLFQNAQLKQKNIQE